MSLLGLTVSYLETNGVAAALVGGGALAVHGVARATEDLDLLTLESRILESTFWSGWRGTAAPAIRRGDQDDPLAGVIRLSAPESAVDLIVGREAWMASILDRRLWLVLSGEKIPVVDAADLILTKLAAGGPQDILDVRLLLGAIGGLRHQVEQRLRDLPDSLRDDWRRVSTE